MTTLELTEWLERHDVPISETVTIDRWLEYCKERLGLKEGSLDVAERVYYDRFELWETVGIKAKPRRYEVRGEKRIETRYGIEGAPGLWGREGMLRIAYARAEEKGLYEFAERIRAIAEEEGFEL